MPAADQTSRRERTLTARPTRHRRLTNPARTAPLLARLFSPGVAAAELRADADAALLYPGESACASGFAPRRVAEFAAGRLCARRALANLGIFDFPIAVGPDRSPRWPPGICGSISHTQGYCCAVAAPAHLVAGIGIDVELVGRVDAELDALVFTRTEADFLASLESRARARAATVIFSAKEAFYKCQYPITQRWLDFTDVTVELEPARGSNSSERNGADADGGSFLIAAPAGRPRLDQRFEEVPRGRFRVEAGVVATGITLR
jgi:4'-phosphopantetheinyl transferase EntD